MAARYKVRLLDQAGALLAEFNDWRSLTYSLRVNGVGGHDLTLDGDLAAIDQFVVDGQVEILRRDLDADPVIDWYVDFEGFHRASVQKTDAQGLSTFSSVGLSYDDLLGRRIIGFRNESTGAVKSGAGETVIKAYVDENAGPGATAPPRLFDGVMPGLVVQIDGGAGSSWEGTRAYQGLLAVIEGIAKATAVDFGIVGTGPATFEFQAQATPWGVDRSTEGLDEATGLNAAGNAPVIFALNFGNLELPEFSINRLNERNAILVLGQGSAADRSVIERTSADVSVSPWNRMEMARAAGEESTTAGLNALGDSKLDELQARETFLFAFIQTPATLYGRDYFLGDIVTAKYKGIERNIQIVGVTVSMEEGQESIGFEVSDVS